MRRLLAVAIAAVVVEAAACSSGSGGSGPSGTCSWATNSTADATTMLGDLNAVGSVTASNGTATVTVNGTIPDQHPINGWGIGVLYSKRQLTGDFDARIHLDDYATTATNMEAFFAAMNGYSGGRAATTRLSGGGIGSRATALGGGFINDGGNAYDPIFRIVRAGGMIYAGFGTSATLSGFEQAPDDGKPLVLGIGLAAQNYPGGDSTGVASALFSNLAVTTTADGTCFSAGL